MSNNKNMINVFVIPVGHTTDKPLIDKSIELPDTLSTTDVEGIACYIESLLMACFELILKNEPETSPCGVYFGSPDEPLSYHVDVCFTVDNGKPQPIKLTLDQFKKVHAPKMVDGHVKKISGSNKWGWL